MKTAAPTYPCAICGKRAPADRMIFSTFTHARYCMDMMKCGTKKKKRPWREKSLP